MCINSPGYLIYGKVEQNQVVRIKTIKWELYIQENKEQQIKLDEEQEKNP